MTTRRAYAASLGLAKAEGRGRLSAAALEAIAEMEAGGMVFEDTAASKARSEKSKTVTVKAGEFDAKKVRAWATSNGISVNARGRLSAEVLDAYRKANPDVKPSETREHIKIVGKDIRPTAARTRSNRTDYTAVLYGKTIRLSEREACKCGYSLSHCSCGSPIVLGMDVTVRSRG
jgi:hypothetical protein